ncbi:hypothetical protein ACOME3_008289 [Neoechinorhynchus agilis]
MDTPSQAPNSDFRAAVRLFASNDKLLRPDVIKNDDIDFSSVFLERCTKSNATDNEMNKVTVIQAKAERRTREAADGCPCPRTVRPDEIGERILGNF